MALTQKQREFLNDFEALRGEKNIFMLAGGAGSGKSFICLLLLHKLCLEFSPIRVGIFRKTTSNLKNNTIPSYRRVLAETKTESSVSLSDTHALYKNGSEILFLWADTEKDPDCNNIKGLELSCALFEEVNQVDKKVFHTVRSRVGRWNSNITKAKTGRGDEALPCELDEAAVAKRSNFNCTGGKNITKAKTGRGDDPDDKRGLRLFNYGRDCRVGFCPPRNDKGVFAPVKSEISTSPTSSESAESSSLPPHFASEKGFAPVKSKISTSPTSSDIKDETHVSPFYHIQKGFAPFILANCNPNNTWVKNDFYDPYINGELPDNVYFQESLPSDNPKLSPEYIKMLETLPEEEKRRYLYNDWYWAQSQNSLVAHDLLEAAWFDSASESLIPPVKSEILNGGIVQLAKQGSTPRFDSASESLIPPVKSEISTSPTSSESAENSHFLHISPPQGLFGDTILAIDPADEGSDSTVFCYIKGGCAFKFEVFDRLNEVKAAHLALLRAKEYGVKPYNIIVDSVGVGAGCLNTLLTEGFPATKFVGGESPSCALPFYDFKNKRAEAAWLLRESIHAGKLKIIRNSRLKNEILAVKYSVDNDKTVVLQQKKDIRKVLGHSPDIFDALMMANYHAQSIIPRPIKAITHRVERLSPMVRGY